MGHGYREGKRNYHFNNREMDSLYSLFLQLTIKTDTVTELNMCPVYFLCVFTCVCERFLFYVCKHACFVYFKASHAVIHFTEAPIFTMGDWLFDCFQGVSAKSLFCDYCLIICPPKHTTISRFHRPGWSGGWALDWQLVNYVISILLGKWRSDNSWLVGERGRSFVTADALSIMDGGVNPGRRNCPTVLFEERPKEREEESQCGQLFIACTRWLVGLRLITFADTCSAV